MYRGEIDNTVTEWNKLVNKFIRRFRCVTNKTFLMDDGRTKTGYSDKRKFHFLVNLYLVWTFLNKNGTILLTNREENGC